MATIQTVVRSRGSIITVSEPEPQLIRFEEDNVQTGVCAIEIAWPDLMNAMVYIATAHQEAREENL